MQPTPYNSGSEKKFYHHTLVEILILIAATACHWMLENCKANFHQGFHRRDGKQDAVIPLYAQSYHKSTNVAKDCPSIAGKIN